MYHYLKGSSQLQIVPKGKDLFFNGIEDVKN